MASFIVSKKRETVVKEDLLRNKNGGMCKTTKCRDNSYQKPFVETVKLQMNNRERMENISGNTKKLKVHCFHRKFALLQYDIGLRKV